MRAGWWMTGVVALAALQGVSAGQAAGGKAGDFREGASLVNTCLITADVKGMVAFYSVVLARKAEQTGEDYAEFHTGVGVLAIFSEQAQQRYIPGAATSAHNRSVILEFRVADVDQEYRRLQGAVKEWVKAPSTQPWGTRSIYFRDPDGNLVDLFSPAVKGRNK